MKVFVINAYEERRNKYDERYTMFPAVLAKDITNEDCKDYSFYWNIKDKLRNNIVACSLSHKKCLEHIVHNKIDRSIIIEDDAIIDFSRLDELKEYKEFTYIGGDIRPPLLKDDKDFKKEMIISNVGKNKIDTDKFVILGCFGMYLPDWEIAKMIIDNIPVNTKEKAIDVEMKKLQKKELIKYYHYPAISTLYLEDAKTGFSAPQMKKLTTFSHY
tara:strand:- start:1875 stop:2519 length:645 start_codon:yes stop_codon:yes gene_type:complete